MQQSAVEQVQGDKAKSAKLIRDGQLLIICDDKTFNALGVKVR